ncbi:MAG: RNA polymerase sigma factor [Anaerolineaceae bacterium]|jgi:RNA polymerase sigma-70 factor (ECF subfamily)
MEQAQNKPLKTQTLSVMSIKEHSPEAIRPLFSDLYRQHASRIYYYLYARVRSTAEAEDLTSQTFITALENYHKLKDQGKFVPWLFTIARNKANDHFRQRYRRKILSLDDEVAAGKQLQANELNTDRMIELEQLISALKPIEQEYLRLRLVAELPFAEIAAILRQPETRIKKSYYRLLERLQAQVE